MAETENISIRGIKSSQQLNNVLAFARLKLDISQTAQAANMGYSGSAHINRIENGTHCPTLKTFMEYLEVLGVKSIDITLNF